MDALPLGRSDGSALPASAPGRHAGQSVGNGAVALAAASGGSVCLLASGTEAPLPALGWAAAFMFLAVERDVRERRIPNWLTGPALCLFVLHHAWLGGAAAAGASLLAAVAALAILVVPYAVGWFGGGDVKALMALAALWGTAVFADVLTWSILCGGAFATAWVTLRGGVPDMLARWSKTLWTSLAVRRWTYFPPEPGSAAAAGMPFAVALVLGVSAYQLWGSVWP